MEIIKTHIDGLLVLKPAVHQDNRGWFMEAFNKSLIPFLPDFIQDNQSYSIKKGVLRGLHFQKNPYGQSKLVRCLKGRIFDVAVDLRKNSRTYLQWYGIELNDQNHLQLFIPKGFAHGFLTLEDDSEVLYKVDQYYNKNSDRAIKYNDQRIGIIWPVEVKIISDKDFNAPSVNQIEADF